MRHCLFYIGVGLAGIAISFVATAILRAATGNDGLSFAIGPSVGLVSMTLLVSYGSLWLSYRDESSRMKPDVVAAELRMGGILALIGFATATFAGSSSVVVAVVTIAFAACGALVGFDIRRRVNHIGAALPRGEAGNWLYRYREQQWKKSLEDNQSIVKQLWLLWICTALLGVGGVILGWDADSWPGKLGVFVALLGFCFGTFMALGAPDKAR